VTGKRRVPLRWNCCGRTLEKRLPKFIGDGDALVNSIAKFVESCIVEWFDVAGQPVG